MKRVVKDIISGMSNLYPKKTGLPVILWVDPVGVARHGKHNTPRLKVQNTPGDKATEDLFWVSISKNPQILAGKCKLTSANLKIVFQYISDYYQDFMDLWNQTIDEDELKERLYIK